MTTENVARAVARGGPMDGKVLGAADGASFEVVMADRTRWEYVATDEDAILTDGGRATVYACGGRI